MTQIVCVRACVCARVYVLHSEAYIRMSYVCSRDTINSK